jgi:hypothetical protein
MFAMNRGEIISAVRSYLNRPNLSSPDIVTMIAACEGELNRILREHPRNVRRVSLVLPADTALLTMPYDLCQLTTLRDSKGNLSQFPPDDRAGAENNGHAFIMRGMVAELFPTPAEDTTYTLDYVAFLRPLSGDTDENWVSSYFFDLYLYGTLKESAVFLKDDPRLQLWQSEFLRRAEGVAGEGWNQNISTAPRVRIG